MSERIDGSRTLLPTAEASQITGFNPTYIQRLLRQNRLEGIKVGGVWLVYEDSLKAFVAQPRKRGPKGPHKKSKQDHLDSPAEIEHGEVEHAEGREAQGA